MDEHTLQVEIPANVPPDWYDVRVTNPSGVTNGLPKGVFIGSTAYIPLITR